MTFDEAFAEAKRRWGVGAEVGAHYEGVESVFTVGFAGEVLGAGGSWEMAFAVADACAGR